MSVHRTALPAAASVVPTEGRTTFFKQGGWLVVATGLSGVFMMGTQMVAQVWPRPEYLLFLALLKVYLLLGIPSIGLQSVFAHEAAGAVTPEQRLDLLASVRTILRAVVLLWLGVAVVAWLGRGYWLELLRVRDIHALWATLGIGLACLWTPVLRGVLQGRQQFLALGAAVILDGAGRFAAVLVFTWLAGGAGQAATGMSGALLGQIAAVGICVWVARDLFSGPRGRFAWVPWLRRVVPLTAGLGTLVILSSSDVIYVQSLFDEERSRFYGPASLVGLALMTFATPVAMVMFPKVARSVALRGGSRAMPLALAATVGVGALGAVACTLFPELPIRLIFFRNPDYWAAAPLVPWFAWALLPSMVSVVLINNLLAQSRFRVVPWVVGVGAVYLSALWLLRPTMLGMEDPLRAFRLLLGVVGACNTVLLAIAAAFTLREAVPAGAGVPSA